MDDHFHSSLRELRLQLDLMNSRTASILNKPRQQSNMLTRDSSEIDSSSSAMADNMQQIRHIGATVGTLAKNQEDRFQALEHQLDVLSNKLDDLALDNPQFTPPESPSDSDSASSHSDAASISSQHSTMPHSTQPNKAPATVADIGGYLYPNYVQSDQSDQKFITDASSFVGRVNRVLRTKSITNIEIFLRGSALRWFHIGLKTDGTHVFDDDKDDFDVVHFCESLVLLFGIPGRLVADVSNVTSPLTSSWMRSVIVEDYIFPALESMRPQEYLFDKDSGATVAVRKALSLYNQSFKPPTVSPEITHYTGYPDIINDEDLLNVLSEIRFNELEQKFIRIRSEDCQAVTGAASTKVSSGATQRKFLSSRQIQQDSVPAVVSGFNGKPLTSTMAGLHDKAKVQTKSSLLETLQGVEIEGADSAADAVEIYPPAPFAESCPTTPIVSCQHLSSNLDPESQMDHGWEEPRIAKVTHPEKVQLEQNAETHEYSFADYHSGAGGISMKDSADNKTGSQSVGPLTSPYPHLSHMTTISHTLSSTSETGILEVPNGAHNCLAGLSFVFTGQVERVSREELQNLVRRHGGKVTPILSKSTDYVVVGANTGPKIFAVLRERNIRIIDEEGLFALISRLPALDCPTPEPSKDAESPKNAPGSISTAAITARQEDGSISAAATGYPSQQQTRPQHQIPQARDCFPLGPHAKAFLDGFKVFPPTNISPNTLEYRNYQSFVKNTLTRMVVAQESSVSRFKDAHDQITQLEAAGQRVPQALITARDVAMMDLQDAKRKIDAMRMQNEQHRSAWCEKSKLSPARKTPVAVLGNDHFRSHSHTTHPATTEQSNNVEMVFYNSQDSARDERVLYDSLEKQFCKDG